MIYLIYGKNFCKYHNVLHHHNNKKINKTNKTSYYSVILSHNNISRVVFISIKIHNSEVNSFSTAFLYQVWSRERTYCSTLVKENDHFNQN
jgi:hypothetical protein